MADRSIHYCPGCGVALHGHLERCGDTSCPLPHPQADPGVVDTLWALVATQLNHLGPNQLVRLEARFRAGAAEHGDDWTTWTSERFHQEIQEEQDDMLLYSAMHAVVMHRLHGGAE